MNKKQKEALVLALLEKGATYREITKRAGVSPNTVKAVAIELDLTNLLLSPLEPLNFMFRKDPFRGSY